MMEDQLRDAYQAAAQTVRPDSIKGLPDQATRPARPASGPASPARSRRARVLVPLAAAAAVAVIAVTASLVLPASVPGGGGAAAPGALPRFFLALPDKLTGDQMAVFSATTGRQLAVIKPPRGSVIDTAAATGNDRTFVVTVEAGSSCAATALYRLRLTAGGGQGSLTPLAIPKISGVVTALAASADGRTIAYATAFCDNSTDSPGAIGVVHTATGQARQWPWRPNPGQTAGSVSITANGRTIEYAASPNKITGPGSGQILPPRTIRLLPADAPPGNAAQRSRAAVTMSRVAPGEIFNSAAIAPDGRTLYFCTQRNPSQPSGGAMVLRGYDVATGVTAVLRTFGPGGCLLGASGNDLLVGHGLGQQGHAQRLARYDVATGKSTPVPVPRPWDEVAGNIPW